MLKENLELMVERVTDADAGVRAAALELFVRIAKLFQLGPSLDGGAPSATSLDGGGSAPATLLSLGAHSRS